MRVQTVDRLSEYFYERLRSALERRRLGLGGPLQIYLVGLLERFASVGPEHALKPLVEHLKDALETPSPHDRLRRYREMGDSALCVCGLFHEHLAARGISRRYVIHMGGYAYRHAGHLAAVPGAGGTASAGVYGELADRFGQIATLLDDVREETSLGTPQDVVQLYERWQKTRSPVLAERLHRIGLHPQDDGRTGWTH